MGHRSACPYGFFLMKFWAPDARQEKHDRDGGQRGRGGGQHREARADGVAQAHERSTGGGPGGTRFGDWRSSPPPRLPASAREAPLPPLPASKPSGLATVTPHGPYQWRRDWRGSRRGRGIRQDRGESVWVIQGNLFWPSSTARGFISHREGDHAPHTRQRGFRRQSWGRLGR